MSENTVKDKELQEYLKMALDPIYFIRVAWNLIPQPVAPQHEEEVLKHIKNREYKKIRPHHFQAFVRHQHITWQQWLILLAIKDAVQGKAGRRISVASGHGIGKSACLAWTVIWFLYCHYLAQVPCTAPSKEQMFDVLWKEVSKWVNQLPKKIKNKFEIQSDYIRVVDRPREWFARAKTARKESPEALAGVHGEHVLLVVDEASGVHDSIFETGEGSLTEENYIMVLISNPTRNIGYFYDTHHKKRDRWQVFSFSSEESPVVSEEYLSGKLQDANGNKDADVYRIRVKGMFPKEGAADDKGYAPLLKERDISQVPDVADDDWVKPVRMGIDPAGEGVDKTSWVIRDPFKAKIVSEELTSTPKKIAQKTLTLMEIYGVEGQNIWIDNFGEGANVAKELALAGINTKPINVGVKPDKEKDKERYLNTRAMAYFRIKEWLRKGGELIENQAWRDELKSIRFRRELSGRIKIMDKLTMKKEGYKSPNNADALMLTFIKEDIGGIMTYTKSQRESNLMMPEHGYVPSSPDIDRYNGI